jgi:hypothetical protein
MKKKLLNYLNIDWKQKSYQKQLRRNRTKIPQWILAKTVVMDLEETGPIKQQLQHQHRSDADAGSSHCDLYMFLVVLKLSS